MLTPEYFGLWVRSERIRQRKTQDVIAIKSEMTQSYVHRLESGSFYKAGPSLDTCNRVLDALGYELKIVPKKR